MTAQLECLLDDVVVGKQEMVGAIDAVCSVAERIIGKLKEGATTGGPPLLGAAFARGRDFSAWIGLVPKQMSTGDRSILGRISKRGNGYLRMLFMQAARVILLRPTSWPKHSFGVWLARAAQRLHRNVLAAALANKLARIAWTVLAQERNYQARVTEAAA